MESAEFLQMVCECETMDYLAGAAILTHVFYFASVNTEMTRNETRTSLVTAADSTPIDGS